MDDKGAGKATHVVSWEEIAQRKRDAALGAAVRKNVAKMSYVGTPEGLRELASYIADPHLPETEAAYSLLHCVADALEKEVE